MENKLYLCIRDFQGGSFGVGHIMTAKEWGELASSWADSDDWENPDEPKIENFKTEQECIDFIQEMWEIEIVPYDRDMFEYCFDYNRYKEYEEKIKKEAELWKN